MVILATFCLLGIIASALDGGNGGFRNNSPKSVGGVDPEELLAQDRREQKELTDQVSGLLAAPPTANLGEYWIELTGLETGITDSEAKKRISAEKSRIRNEAYADLYEGAMEAFKKGDYAAARVLILAAKSAADGSANLQDVGDLGAKISAELAVEEEKKRAQAFSDSMSDAQKRYESKDYAAAREAVLRAKSAAKTSQELKKCGDLGTKINAKLAALAEQERKAERIRNSKWVYNSWTDEMGSRFATAAITSTNTIEFEFPYQGEQHATLTIRKSSKSGTDMYLQIERGQFICNSYDGCRVSMNFDNSGVRRYSAVGPADYSTETIFIRNEDQIVSKLKSADTLAVSATFFQEGDRAFTFDVAGLDANQLQLPPK